MSERRLKVMIVNDERTITHAFSTLLGVVGLEAMECNDGHRALNTTLISTHPPDLFMIDWTMPKMDGFELTCALRQKGYRQPIILMWSAEISAEYLPALGSPRPFTLLIPVSAGELIGATIRALRSSELPLPALWHPGLNFSALQDKIIEKQNIMMSHRVESDQEALKQTLGISISDCAALTLTRRYDSTLDMLNTLRFLQDMILNDERLRQHGNNIILIFIERFLAPGVSLTRPHWDPDLWLRLDLIAELLPGDNPSRRLCLFSDIALLIGTAATDEVNALLQTGTTGGDPLELLWGVMCGAVRFSTALDESVDRLALRSLADKRVSQLEEVYFPPLDKRYGVVSWAQCLIGREVVYYSDCLVLLVRIERSEVNGGTLLFTAVKTHIFSIEANMTVRQHYHHETSQKLIRKALEERLQESIGENSSFTFGGELGYVTQHGSVMSGFGNSWIIVNDPELVADARRIISNSGDDTEALRLLCRQYSRELSG